MHRYVDGKMVEVEGRNLKTRVPRGLSPAPRRPQHLLAVWLTLMTAVWWIVGRWVYQPARRPSLKPRGPVLRRLRGFLPQWWIVLAFVLVLGISPTSTGIIVMHALAGVDRLFTAVPGSAIPVPLALAVAGLFSMTRRYERSELPLFRH